MNEIGSLIESAIEAKNYRLPSNDAFTLIVQKYQDMVFGYIFAIIRDYFVAQDLTQEVFIIAYNKLESLCNYNAFSKWLQQIAKRVCLRELDRKKKRELPLDNIDISESTALTPEESYELNEFQNEVQRAIAKLPQIHRIPTILYYINDYSQQNVADFLNIGLDTVKKRLERARNYLKVEMTPMLKENLGNIRPSKDDELVTKVSLYTTFDTAAKNEQLELMEQMLVDGIDINEKDAAGKTLLHWAVENGHTDGVRLLIKNGANRFLEDKTGKNSIELAKRKNHKAIIRILGSDETDV